MTSVTDELGTIEYTYDRNSNVLTVSDGQGTIKRKYDALNRVTEYTDYQGNTIKYAYDELGNLISLTYPGGEIVRYTYYKNGLLNTVTDHKGRTTTYEYDANENLTVTIRPNGTKEIRTYNAAGQMTEQRDVKVAEGEEEEIILQYTYTYDAAGNIASITGKETTDTKEGLSNLSTAVMTYDEGNRLLTYNGEELQYDADGNMTYGPVDGQMSELTFDCRNRLVKAGGVTYTYDPENNRISAETDEYTETYVTDTTSSSMSRVLSSTKVYKSSNAKDTTLYIYGNGLISEHMGDIHLYHHYDNLGSTTKLTNLKGEVVETYTYGTYGELLSGNKTLTRFLYNGRFGISTDDNGLYYMRLRYYNPQIKRFINQDIVTGEIGNSQSLNRYSYVQGNPVSYTDPFGMNPFAKIFTKEFAHTLLGFLSCVPGIGWAASGLDGILYWSEENYAMATLCFMDTASFGFGKIGRLMLKGSKLKNTGVLIIRSSAVLSKISNMGQNIYAGIDSIYRMHEEGINGWDIFSLGISAVGTFFSAKGLMDEVGDFRGTCGYKGFLGDVGGEIKTAAKEWWANRPHGANLGIADFSVIPDAARKIKNSISKGGNSSDELVHVYRGTDRYSELSVFKETGHLMSDSTRNLYVETGNLKVAYAQSNITHNNWLKIWGNENDYVQAHAAFGTELSDAFGLDRTFMSVTTDPNVARKFAGEKGRVFEAYIPRSQLIKQTLSGAGESEYLIRFGAGGFK